MANRPWDLSVVLKFHRLAYPLNMRNRDLVKNTARSESSMACKECSSPR